MITAIVLAGGRSARFGGDKLAADLDGGSVLQATIEAVAPIVDRVVVAGSRLPDGLAAGETPVALAADREPFAGPLVALSNALSWHGQAGSEDLAIVVGGDMPRVVPAVLRAMLDRLAADQRPGAVVLEVAGQPRQVLPVALRVRAAAAAATAALEQGDRSLRALVDRLASVAVPEVDWQSIDPEGRTLLDVDTRADLERLRAEGSRNSPGRGSIR